VYVQTFPPSGGKWQISANGGFEPHWRGDGKEIFYSNAGGMWSVDVNAAGSSFAAGVPKKLFDGAVTAGTLLTRDTVTPDGQRFLLNLNSLGANVIPPIRVVLNWTTDLRQ
jgi:hypothetical protein